MTQNPYNNTRNSRLSPDFYSKKLCQYVVIRSPWLRRRIGWRQVANQCSTYGSGPGLVLVFSASLSWDFFTWPARDGLELKKSTRPRPLPDYKEFGHWCCHLCTWRHPGLRYFLSLFDAALPMTTHLKSPINISAPICYIQWSWHIFSNIYWYFHFQNICE